MGSPATTEGNGDKPHHRSLQSIMNDVCECNGAEGSEDLFDLVRELNDTLDDEDSERESQSTQKPK